MASIQMDDRKRELADKDDNSVKERKVIMPEVRFSSHVNGVLEEKGNRGNVNTASVQQPLAMQPEELSDGEFMDIVRSMVMMERMRMSQRKGPRHKNSY